MVQQIYVNKDLDSWLKLEYDAILRTFSTVYADEKYLIQLLEDYKKEFNYNYSAIPITSYKKEIKGNGKLIVLKQISNNWYYRNSGAAELQYIDDDGDPAGIMPIILLYLPEGRSLDEGLMIWK